MHVTMVDYMENSVTTFSPILLMQRNKWLTWALDEAEK